jgi:outer membrane receptor protein involved in Fe transport
MKKNLKTNGWGKSVSSTAIGIALGFALIATTPAFAVETTATLRGKVTAAGAGAQVSAVNTENGAKTSVKVNADGTYTLVGLRPGTYDVSFTTADKKVVRQRVVLSVGETAQLDGNMANAADSVVIVGRRREVRTSEVATSVSRQQIEALPQQGRNFLNFAAVAPGVSVSYSENNKQFRSGALDAEAVNVFIDGLSQKNQVLKGVAGQDNSRGNPFPQGAIQEYKVSTQNFKAEYEQASTAIITAVTKSGTNEIHGEVFGNFQTKDMIGQPYYSRNSAKPDYSNQEYGLNIGGPILKDKLFYFLSYEHRTDSRPSDSVLMPTASNLGGNTALANALATNFNGAFAKDFAQDSYFGKLTYVMDDNNTIDVSYRNRDEDDMRDFGGTTARSAGSTVRNYAREASAQWKRRGDNYLNEMAVEYQSAHFVQESIEAGANIKLLGVDGDLGSVRAQFGGYDYGQDKGQDLWNFKNNLTLTGIEWHGRHVIKTGVKVSKVEVSAREGQDATNPTLYYNASTYVFGATNNVPVGALIFDGDPTVTADNTQVGLFVQDDWTYNDKWTFNLGIRWDWESNMMNNDYITPSDVAAAIRGWTNFSNGGFDPENYIASEERDTFKGAIQPRFGFSYDVNGNRDLVVFGGAGRYYDRTMFDRAQMEPRRQTIHRVQLRFPTDGAWNPSFATDTAGLIALAKARNLKGEIFAIADDVKVPYTDQFNLGVRKKFGDINTSATLAHTESYDLFNWIVGNRQADGSWGNSWAGSHGEQYETTPWGDTIPGYGGLFVSSNDRRARQTSLYLTADKPYTKESGYGWSAKLDLNDAKMLGSNEWLHAMTAFMENTGWNHAEGVDKWRFVGTGTVDAPMDIKLSGILTLASGGAFRAFVESGTNGAPASRFIPGAYFPADNIGFKMLDVKAAKDFALPNGTSFTLEAQIFNAFDWVNNNYGEWESGKSTAANPIAHRLGDNSTMGPARSYQIGVKYKW